MDHLLRNPKRKGDTPSTKGLSNGTKPWGPIPTTTSGSHLLSCEPSYPGIHGKRNIHHRPYMFEMSYIKRKLDFSDGWYPAEVLRRYSYLIGFFCLGFLWIMFMIVDEDIDYMGLSTNHTSLGRALLYTALGMLSIILVLNSLMLIAFMKLAMGKRGMVLREFSLPRESVERVLEGLFDADSIKVEGEEIVEERGWRTWPDMFPFTNIHIKGFGLTLAVGIGGWYRRTLVLIGPIDERNRSGAQKLQEIIDVALSSSSSHDMIQHDSLRQVDSQQVGAAPDTRAGPAFTDAPRIRM